MSARRLIARAVACLLLGGSAVVITAQAAEPPAAIQPS